MTEISSGADAPITRRVHQRLTTTLFVAHSSLIAANVASFTLMPIIATQLVGESAAGVPSTISMVGRALAGYPIGWLMDRYGRRFGLSVGYFVAMLGGIVSVIALGWASFFGFCLGMGLLGAGRATSEQARFIAAEISPAGSRAKVIGYIVAAGIIGGVGGPLLVAPSTRFVSGFDLIPNTGPYFLVVLLGLISLLLIQLFLRPEPLTISRAYEKLEQATTSPTALSAPPRSMRQIVAEPRIQLAIASLAIGQFVMTWLMVIMPVHMSHNAHTTFAISSVIALHNAGMYAFSWCTGWLIDRYGHIPTIVLGGVTMAISSILTPVSGDFVPVALAMFLVGLGWNFSFVAGSSLLSDSLTPNERGHTQGASESLIAVAGVGGSLGTGFAFAAGGVNLVNAVGILFSLALLVGVALFRASQRARVTVA